MIKDLKTKLENEPIPIHIRNNSKIINILTDIKDKIKPNMDKGKPLFDNLDKAVNEAVTAITGKQ